MDELPNELLRFILLRVHPSSEYGSLYQSEDVHLFELNTRCIQNAEVCPLRVFEMDGNSPKLLLLAGILQAMVRRVQLEREWGRVLPRIAPNKIRCSSYSSQLLERSGHPCL